MAALTVIACELAEDDGGVVGNPKKGRVVQSFMRDLEVRSGHHMRVVNILGKERRKVWACDMCHRGPGLDSVADWLAGTTCMPTGRIAAPLQLQPSTATFFRQTEVIQIGYKVAHQ